MKNERGGIISTIFVIPIGIALMIGIFFLGYYVGKYKSKTVGDENIVPLPEVVSQNLPKKEEFTFFKTLTDRQNKTVSIDLKPAQKEEVAPQKKEAPAEPKKEAQAEQKKESQPKKEKKPEARIEKAEKTAAVVKAPEQKAPAAKKEPVITRSANSKIRYTLQIASYQEKDMAEADVKKMKQHGYSAFVVSSEIEGKGTWYRVRVGSFTNKAAAEKLQKEIRSKEDITPFITLE